MDLDEARRFLREHHRAVLATVRRDGTPQLSPVAVGVDADGFAVVSTRETAMKARNLRRDPRVTMCVLSEGFFGPWVTVSGEAHIVSLPDAMDGLVDYYRTVSGEHPDWAEYRRAMESEQRCLVRIRLAAAGPDRAG